MARFAEHVLQCATIGYGTRRDDTAHDDGETRRSSGGEEFSA